MTKRILSMVLALTMVMGILIGCGAGSGAPANGITVSEMLNSIIEENGEVVIYDREYNLGVYGSIADITDKNGNPKAINENHKKYNKTVYDGKKGVTYKTYFEFSIGELLTDSSVGNESLYTFKHKEMSFAVDNNVTIAEGLRLTGKNITFGEFSREEIAGESCMVFRTYTFRKSTGALEDYNVTIIKDTDYTKDKTIVFDTTDLEDATITDKFNGIDPKDYYITSDINWTPNK